MKAVHVVPHIGNAASGPSYSVPALGRALGEQGCDVTLLTQAYDAVAPSEGFQNISLPERQFPHGLHWSPQLGRVLHQQAAQADIIHNHSIWLAPNIYTGFAAKRSGVPLILSPRGVLSPAALEKSPWKKKFIWPLQRVAFDQARCFHATAEKEYEEIRAFEQRAPVAIIPNGVDLPEAVDAAPHPDKTLLFLGRIHPIKGLDLLLEVWDDLPDALRAGWTLRIVGDDLEGHRAELHLSDVSCRDHRFQFGAMTFQ
ncbi:MAG: glycosyltransferase, partial [Pseudomonadota bacterium]